MSSFHPKHPRERLIVALDVPRASEALRLAEELSGEVGLFKVGLELFCAEGPDLVKALSRHARIFLDLKFLDIPNTVTGALRSVLPLDPYFLTVHATGGMPMMKAVNELLQAHRQQGGQTRSLAVTVLTSFDETEWKNVGQTHDTATSVLNLARLAQQSGMDGGCAHLEKRGNCVNISALLFIWYVLVFDPPAVTSATKSAFQILRRPSRLALTT